MKKKDKFIFYLTGVLAPYIFLFGWVIGIQVVFLAFSLIILIFSTLFAFLSVPEIVLQIFAILILLLYLIIVLIFLPKSELKILRKSYKEQLEKYKSSGGKLSPRIIKKLTLSYWVISFLFWLAFLIAIVIPAFEDVKSQPYSAAVKNGLVNGVKECIVREADDQTTRFGDVQSFSSNYTKFKIESLDPNSCYKAKAVPTTDQNTWFEIYLNNYTGEVSKTCGDSSKSGCEEGNTW